MKRAISLVLLAVMLLVCIGCASCGGAATPPSDGGATPAPTPADGGSTPAATPTPTPTPSDGGTTPTPTPTPTPGPSPTPSGGQFTWDDMPVYPGADEAAKGAAIPEEEAEFQWERVEWRYYSTGDSYDKVVTFYQSGMPGNGWQEDVAGRVEVEGMDMSWYFYAKNSEQDGAFVWIYREGDETFIGLMRGSK